MNWIIALYFIVMGFLAGNYVRPSIADQEVPSGLHCQEDEVISWVAVDTLGCVHIEEIGKQ